MHHNKAILQCRKIVPEIWIYFGLQLFEETGFDAGDRVRDNCYVEYTAGDQYSRLYIVPGECLGLHNTRLHSNITE